MTNHEKLKAEYEEEVGNPEKVEQSISDLRDLGVDYGELYMILTFLYKIKTNGFYRWDGFMSFLFDASQKKKEGE